MCGIAGIFILNDHDNIDFELLQKMRDEMTHRGPDDSGIYISSDKKVGLAHRRLSILDLSSAGHQPMSDTDETIWIVFNGEIYNFRELREELENKGYKFKSNSDTEVLIHLYKEYGKEMLHRLRGMFAFALWDERKKELWLVRDRIGKKPLYYTFTGNSIIFASEIKAILKHPNVARELNEEAFYHYLSFLTTPAPDTLFKGIKKLPAGFHLTVSATGSTKLEKWWDVFDNVKPITGKIDEDELAENILSLLRESIKYRMVSDVPFGVFLSGGIDSSLNVALMSELMDRPVQTFSVGYVDAPQYNEFQYARRVAEIFGADHHEIIISSKDMVDFLPKLVYHQDEPISDPVCVPLYYVAKLAKDSGVTVCQVGEGSDELFCGYPHWVNVLKFRPYLETAGRIPFLLKGILTLAKILGKGTGFRYEYLRRAAEKESIFWGGAESLTEGAKKQLLRNTEIGQKTRELSSYTVIAALQKRFEENTAHELRSYLNFMTYLDLRLRLPELLLMRVDKMTMATSLEARVPFLDHKFVEFVMGIPQEIKVKNNEPKYILKKAAVKVLPEDIVYRRKQGFGVPVTEWFVKELGKFTVEKVQEFQSKHRFFNDDYLNQMISKGDAWSLWFLLNFILWYEAWFI